MRSYSVEPETIAAMLTYCNLTPGIVQEITTAMTTLMSAFEAESKGVVGAHVEGYRDLLMEFKALMSVISGDVGSSMTETKRKALIYQEVLSKKIR